MAWQNGSAGRRPTAAPRRKGRPCDRDRTAGERRPRSHSPRSAGCRRGGAAGRGGRARPGAGDPREGGGRRLSHPPRPGGGGGGGRGVGGGEMGKGGTPPSGDGLRHDGLAIDPPLMVANAGDRAFVYLTLGQVD